MTLVQLISSRSHVLHIAWDYLLMNFNGFAAVENSHFTK